jgi:hypothetical protein
MKQLFTCLLTVLTLLNNWHFAQAGGLPFTAGSYSVGTAPACVIATDINGDGSLDLIGANSSDNTLTLLLNDGYGHFSNYNTLNVGKGPTSVVAADINGDDYVDLVCANFGAGGGKTLTVLTNDGTGVFGLNATLTVGGGPMSVVAADVNGDGKLDLITANAGTNGNGSTLTILTNSGSGGFHLSSTLTVGTDPVCVIAADVNGDGKLDLICANDLGNSLTVLTNNGSGRFVTSATLTVDVQPTCVIAADVNGDGKLDLISANLNNAASTLMVLTNNGSGAFVFSARLSLPKYGNQYPALPESVVAADLDGDGRMDLISANSDYGKGGSLSIFTNNNSYHLGSNSVIYVDTFPNCVVAADLNGDGKPDLISANQVANTLNVLLNSSTFPPSASTPTLKLNLQSNATRVSWPSASPGWSLQEKTDLTRANWLPSGCGGYLLGDDGTNKNLVLPYPKGNRFFRLLHP